MKELERDESWLSYADNCIKIVEAISEKYEYSGVIYPDEIKAIYKKYGMQL